MAAVGAISSEWTKPVDHILTAHQHVLRLAQAQVRWGESGILNGDALVSSRQRAIISVMGKHGATTEELSRLHFFLVVFWDIELERRVLESPHWMVVAEVGEENDYEITPELDRLWLVIEDLWNDVVVETDRWARRISDRLAEVRTH